MLASVFAGSVWNVLSPFASLRTRMTQARRQAERMLQEEESLWAMPALKLEGLAEEISAWMEDRPQLSKWPDRGGDLIHR
jgi:hypothetical protein